LNAWIKRTGFCSAKDFAVIIRRVYLCQSPVFNLQWSPCGNTVDDANLLLTRTQVHLKFRNVACMVMVAVAAAAAAAVVTMLATVAASLKVGVLGPTCIALMALGSLWVNIRTSKIGCAG